MRRGEFLPAQRLQYPLDHDFDDDGSAKETITTEYEPVIARP
jgi:hypothetical protein